MVILIPGKIRSCLSLLNKDSLNLELKKAQKSGTIAKGIKKLNYENARVSFMVLTGMTKNNFKQNQKM